MAITSRTIQGFIAKDNDAITEVYMEYKNLLYFVIANYVDNQEDCNDVLSTVFIKAIEHRNDLKNSSSLKTFLCSIAKNEAINFSKKNRLVPSSDVIEEVYGEKDEPDSVLTMLEPLLNKKEIIVLYYKAVFDFTWDEITMETGIPTSTARLIYKQAKEKMRKELRR